MRSSHSKVAKIDPSSLSAQYPMPNIKVNWNQVSRDVAKLGQEIFQQRIQGATDDAVDFLKMVEKDVIKLHLQLAAGEITKQEFDDLMLDRKALAKMEALKQKGLTQAAIDQFVNGAINILLSAAISAIP